MVILTALTVAFIAYLIIGFACYLGGLKGSLISRLRTKLPLWLGGVRESEQMFSEILRIRDRFNTHSPITHQPIPKVAIPGRTTRQQPKYLDRYHFTQLQTENLDSMSHLRKEDRFGSFTSENSAVPSQNFGGTGGLTLPFIPRETFECVDGAYSRKGTRVPGNAAFASLISTQKHYPHVHDNQNLRSMHKDLAGGMNLLLPDRRPTKNDLPEEANHTRGAQPSILIGLSGPAKGAAAQGRKKLRKTFNLSESWSQQQDQQGSKTLKEPVPGSAAGLPSQRTRVSRAATAAKRRRLDCARVYPKADLSVIPESREESEDKRSTCITEPQHNLGPLTPEESAYYSC